MKRPVRSMLSLLLCLLICLSLIPVGRAAGQRVFSDSWKISGKTGNAFVEKAGERSLYFEIQDTRGSGHWEIELYFSTGAVLSLNSEWGELMLYADSMGMELMLADSVEIQILRRGSTDYGQVEIPSEWDSDVSLSKLNSGGVILVDAAGGIEYCSDTVPSFDSGDQIPANMDLGNGVFYAILWGAERSGNTWSLHLTLHSYDLYSDSYVRSLRKGDYVDVATWPERVEEVDSTSILLESGSFLTPYNIDWSHPDLVPEGYWVVCSPGGLIVQYEVAEDDYPASSEATYIDNSSFSSIHVSGPKDLFTESFDYRDGVLVIVTLHSGTVTSMERIYVP